MIGSGIDGTGCVRPAHWKVSILVVLDDWFGLSSRNDWAAYCWFQSLLFWMIGSGQGKERKGEGKEDVSILVVLDDWFGLLDLFLTQISSV